MGKFNFGPAAAAATTLLTSEFQAGDTYLREEIRAEQKAKQIVPLTEDQKVAAKQQAAYAKCVDIAKQASLSFDPNAEQQPARFYERVKEFCEIYNILPLEMVKKLAVDIFQKPLNDCLEAGKLAEQNKDLESAKRAFGNAERVERFNSAFTLGLIAETVKDFTPKIDQLGSRIESAQQELRKVEGGLEKIEAQIDLLPN